jgi:hypothetical protein
VVQGADPSYLGVVEAESRQGSEQEVPLYPIKGFFKVKEEKDQLLVALLGLGQGVLG